MQVQVLVATMNQVDYSLLSHMNIQSDVIVGNQCDRNCIERFEYNGHKVVYLNFAEKGVGLNRNNALMRANGDICLFADDDETFVDDYAELIECAFFDYPNADIIVFNIIGRPDIKKAHRVGYLNYLRYGTARVAIRLESVKKKGIYFNQCFGGGTEYFHGEDSLFLTECLRKGLKIYAVPIMMGALNADRDSTWNTGDITKYLKDQGVLYRTISHRWGMLLCLQDAIRRRKTYKMPWYKAFFIMTRRKKEK